MHHPENPKNMPVGSFFSICRNLRRRLQVVLGIVLLIVCAIIPFSAHAQSATNPSGLPLPRFATTRSNPINVRVGPGTKYEISWVYVKAGIPVEIVQEFDTWRKIRDFEGELGWVHQNLLSGRRAGRISLAGPNGQIALRAKPLEGAAVRAWLTMNFPVILERCDGDWCTVNAEYVTENGRKKTFKGFLPQISVWGAYPGEEFD